MKKQNGFAALATIILLFAIGCKVETPIVEVESVSLEPTSITLALGATAKLTATVEPENADDKVVTWSSSDKSVAIVDSDGTIEAIKVGTATVTARAGGKTAVCEVTVNKVSEKPKPVAVECVTLNAETLTVEPGKTRKLTATVMPSNADDKTVIWLSSSDDIATVSDDGTVTAVAEGTATITAQVGEKTATCTVTVKSILISVDSITLNTYMLTLTRGETAKLSATVTPDNADDPSVAWSSSDPAVATVDNDGTVTSHALGLTIITAQAGDITATCAVYVDPIPVESVTLDKTTLTLTTGSMEKLTATIKPDNADDKTVIWSLKVVINTCGGPVASVFDDGTIKTFNTGTVIITARAGDSAATCKVIIEVPLLEGATIDDDGGLTKYTGNEANLVIPDGVTSINYEAFKGCAGLESVIIPDSVTYIANSAFEGCTNLTSITIPNSVERIYRYAFKGCTSLKFVEIPNSVIEISEGAFCGCTSLETVTIPGSVTSLSNDYRNYGVFENCTNLTEVIIGDGVTRIGERTFRGCTKLKRVEIPNSVIKIEKRAFYECESLESVTIPDGITYIEEETFLGCTNLKKVYIPASVKGISDVLMGASNQGAFEKCDALKTVQYGGTLTQWCTITGLYNLMIHVEHLIIDNTDICSIRELVIPNDVPYINSGAFSCGFNSNGNVDFPDSVYIPEGVSSIGEYAFGWFDEIMNLSIPASVKSIGSWAFSSGVVNTVKYGGTLADWCGITWEGWYANPLRNYETVRLYIGGKEVTDVVIPESITEIKSYAFAYKNLTSVTIPDSVIKIGAGAFEGSSLETVTIPASVTSIGEEAFEYCTRLTSVTIGNGVTNIGKRAFVSCTGLTDLTLGNGVTSINYEAFKGCTGLTSVTIPDRVTNIGMCAFDGCTGLTSVTIPNRVTNIGVCAFDRCTQLTSIKYGGTMAQWNAISKEDNWDYSTGNYTITCTDGTISK